MRQFFSSGRTLAFAALSFAAVACGKDDRSTTPGPAERAGQKVDEAAHDTKEGTKDAAHAVKEGTQEGARETRDAARGAATAAGSAVERAGEKMQGK